MQPYEFHDAGSRGLISFWECVVTTFGSSCSDALRHAVTYGSLRCVDRIFTEYDISEDIFEKMSISEATEEQNNWIYCLVGIAKFLSSNSFHLWSACVGHRVRIFH